jgi:hypothetical protein
MVTWACQTRCACLPIERAGLDAGKELFDHSDRVLRLVDEEQVAGGADDVLATVGHDRHEDFVVDRRHERVVFTG